ncbi:hypothetical protein CY34DRAFT_16713 [Suillus luteus UH-Slu-Lm8-n1]|uniref:Uncharacterized protein n=1 Tax=Suillus luteus UH-Slu-Lm8-n1 TaxID=930992 RepID=A0A0D0ACV6_9AGAM|nr:hypothetical protein CY34DRAFT_16713 [Suillus luteus UH-Slu-Lm8-n1]
MSPSLSNTESWILDAPKDGALHVYHAATALAVRMASARTVFIDSSSGTYESSENGDGKSETHGS